MPAKRNTARRKENGEGIEEAEKATIEEEKIEWRRKWEK